MENNSPKQPRREFLGSLAAGAAAISVATLATPLAAAAEKFNSYGTTNPDDAEAWFAKVDGGKHKIMFDVTRPHEALPFAWPKVYMLTNAGTGTPDKDNRVVVVLRHDGIPYAFEDRIWAKYKFGEVFKADDPLTKAPSTRNPFWKPKTGDFSFPGLGNVDIGINQLQDIGVMFCVCAVAIQVYTSAVAKGMGANADDVKKDWLSGLLPGVQVVPSGVWAVGRAQEHGCGYCFAG